MSASDTKGYGFAYFAWMRGGHWIPARGIGARTDVLHAVQLSQRTVAMSYERSLPMAMLPNDSHPGAGCSCEQCLRAHPDDAPRIQVDHNPWAPRHCRYTAVDANTYDADCDEQGYFSRSPMGQGETYDAAVADLREQLGAK